MSHPNVSIVYTQQTKHLEEARSDQAAGKTKPLPIKVENPLFAAYKKSDTFVPSSKGKEGK